MYVTMPKNEEIRIITSIARLKLSFTIDKFPKKYPAKRNVDTHETTPATLYQKNFE
jgi:hypothetical protein